MTQPLPRRPLGSTGLDVSILGLGGFHQVEIPQELVDEVVGRYLAAGGNYIETARGYGQGASEIKLGRALKGRRDGVTLATKVGAKSYEEAWTHINESLERLQVSYIDVMFYHGIASPEKLDAICGPDGAAKAFDRAKDEGLIGHVAMSSHSPMMYVEASARLPIEAVLIWGNYLDFCNFPEIPRVVIPALRERGVGVIFMKPLGDGFLYRSPRMALRYAKAQDVDCIVAGFNSLELLETDLEILCDLSPVTDDEVVSILRDAPELGDYVCRQCAACPVCAEGESLKRVFELEGKHDRQMDDRRPTDAAHYALRERLKGWFNTKAKAAALYAELGEPAPRLAETLTAECPYGVDVARKLLIAHAKLSESERVETL